ncbi:MAG: nicotinamide mononucleotide transporter family protein [Acidimicrobiia bacterium]
MTLFGFDVPIWTLDWSGSIFVVISLWFLWNKRQGYWHWSNASLIPYFALFVSTQQYMLAGLQVSYLIFGVHGLLLWRLEHRSIKGSATFNRPAWYAAGWILTGLIFLYSAHVTEFVDGWAWFQFAIVAASLLANLATTRRWIWSWYLWITVNFGQAIYFWHLELWAQFGLQFILAAMSVEGIRRWSKEAQPIQILSGPLENLETLDRDR